MSSQAMPQMLPQSLPKPWRRVLAIGLVVVALGLAAFAALFPILRADAMKQELESGHQQLAVEERLRKTPGATVKSIRREVLVPGATDGLAGAELQRHVSELARASTLALRSTQIAAPKREADLTAVSVDASLQGSIEGLRSLLHAIEAGDPLLFVEGLSIRSIAGPPGQQRPVSLDIKLKVRGYAVTNKAN
jgi:hypothetical protein